MTVLICGAIVITLGMGIRQSFGIFLKPVTADLEVGRQVFGLAIALQTLLTGLLGPVAGMLSDRFGPQRVIAAGASIYGVGLVLTGFAQGPGSLILTLGGVVGLGMSLLTLPVVLGAVGRVVPARSRGTAFGLVTAGGSFGQFAMVPGAQALVTAFDWQSAFMLLSIGMAVAFATAFGLAHKSNAASAPVEGEDVSAVAALTRAGKHPAYWLLTLSFFVCGFHVSFVATHLPAYLADRGISASVAANSLALIGFFNIFGSYIFGALCSRYAKKYLLTTIYASRAVLFVLIATLPMTPTLALVFGAVMGFLWLGTVPPTSGLVAQLFGTRYLATLFGVVFMGHQIGGFLGAWFAGYLFDTTGSYQIAWTISIALGVFGALVLLPVGEARPGRLPTAAAS
ncbi:MAG: MFS transporter [Proteobacteria bacterium]|nr:MFS transporter [Burkholderiales bacterium]